VITACTTSTESQLAAIGDLMVLLSSTASSSGLDLALTAATDWVERYITNARGGSIRRQVVRETVAGGGTQNLMLTHTPVRKVIRMFDSTSTGTGGGTEYCSTDFRLEDPDAGFVTLTNDAGFRWDAVWGHHISRQPRPGAVARRWLVQYEAGWIFNETSSTCSAWLTTSTGRTLPFDVERAVLLKAAEFAGGSATGIKSMTVGPLSINYGSEQQDPIAQLLTPYRRIV
jgi:hypothetical protein